MRGSILRAGLTAALTVTLALPGVASAAARATHSETVILTGSLTIAWSGDSARGCAAAGECGVSGALQILPTGETSGTPTVPLEVSDFNAAARVIGRGPDGSVQTSCADLVPVEVTLGIRHVAGRLRAVMNGPFEAPSSGRCAGPTAQDLVGLSLPARRLGAHSYDLSGETTFGAGPFSVTTISTLRALVTIGGSATGAGLGPIGLIGGTGGSFSGTFPVGSPPQTHRVLQESAAYDYRIQGVTGTLSTTFAGLAEPLCLPVGACNTTGELSESFAAGGMITFSGSRTVKRRVGSAAALADLRAGRMRLTDTFSATLIREVLGERLRAATGMTCTAQGQLAFTGQSRSGGPGVDELLLGPGLQGGLGIPSADPVRTRCPGPSAEDVLGGRRAPLATGAVTAGELGASQLSVTLNGAGDFTGSGYAGTRSGSVVLTLALVRARGGTRRVRQFGGVPGVGLP